MKALLFSLASLLLQTRVGSPVSTNTPVVVVIETDAGDISIEVAGREAPVTAANFLRYVDGGFYSGGEFHRSVRPDTEVRKDAPIQVIQARINQARAKEGFPAIPLERTSITGLKHLDGTISMARDVTPTAPGPDTATSQIFICIGDQPSLDHNGNRSPDRQGFAAFGKVIEGMSVVRRIQLSPVAKNSPSTQYSAQGQTLEPTIKIIRAYRK